MKDLTELEKAALTYCHYHGLNYLTAYNITHKLKVESGNSSLSRWLHSPKIQAYIKELDRLAELRVQAMAGRAGSGTGDGFASAVTDFTDLSQFIAYLNERANVIADETQRQKYLAMLSDLLRFKETGRDSNSDIQRYYVPLQCHDCPLYRRESAEDATL